MSQPTVPPGMPEPDRFPGEGFPKTPTDPWQTWPFGEMPPGSEDSWLFVLTKGLFLLLIFAVIIALIRWLFGPGGRLAEPWMHESWEEKRQADLAELERKREAGELSEAKYQRRKRKLEK